MNGASCYCGGNNENCRFCGGSGVRPTENLGTFLGGPTSPRDSRLAGSVWEGPSGRKRKRVRGTTIGLSGRNVSIPPTRPGPPDSASRKLVICEYCGCSVRFDRHDRHVKKVHLKSRSRFRRSPKFQSKPNLAVPNTTQEETRVSRTLDATREYAHSFREEGRYGSHPSHDRFDDDSNP